MSAPSSPPSDGDMNTPAPPGEAPWHPPKGGIPLVGLADSPVNRGGKPAVALHSGPPSPVSPLEAPVRPPQPPSPSSPPLRLPQLPPSPSAATTSISVSISEQVVDERAVQEYLKPRGWPSGLQSALIANLNKTPVRYFLLGDSRSMNTKDGKRVVGSGPSSRLLDGCTRWEELGESLKFHLYLSQAARAPTEFRFINGGDPAMIGQSRELDGKNIPGLLARLEDTPTPGGGTPLCDHLREIAAEISAMAPQLRDAGKRAAIVIMTDGEAIDGDLSAVMKIFKTLPVFVVVRLCTEEEKVVEYWDGMIRGNELFMDVIEDPLREAEEVQENNPWLTYGEPIHRLREFGVPVKEVFSLDTAKFSIERMTSLCALLFNVRTTDLPDPSTDWTPFSAAVAALCQKEHIIWNPVSRCMCPWIDVNKLSIAFGKVVAPAGNPKGPGGNTGNTGNISSTSNAAEKASGGCCCTLS